MRWVAWGITLGLVLAYTVVLLTASPRGSRFDRAVISVMAAANAVIITCLVVWLRP